MQPITLRPCFMLKVLRRTGPKLIAVFLHYVQLLLKVRT